MPEIIIVAGPNGAGKTTFANEFLSTPGDMAYVNADKIARGLADLTPPERDVRAGRLMLQQIDALIEAGTDFMFETMLASLTWARRIPEWRRLGWRVGLAYLRLPTVEASIARVQRPVGAGGHDIPEVTIAGDLREALNHLIARPAARRLQAGHRAQGASRDVRKRDADALALGAREHGGIAALAPGDDGGFH